MRVLEIEFNKVIKQRAFCHSQICYWEEQYRKAKEREDIFYQKCYWRQINRWQAQYEMLGWVLEEGNEVENGI